MTDTLDSLSAPPAAAATPLPSFGHRLIPAGDPLAGQAFEAIYEARIKPQLEACEAQRRRAVWIFVAGAVLAVVLAVLEYVLSPVVTGRPDAQPSFGFVLFTVLVVVLLGYVPLAGVGSRARVAVIQALCEPLGVTYADKINSAPSYDSFLALRLLPRPTTATFTDMFSGRRGDVDFALCEARLTRGSGKDRHTVFQGQVFRLVTPRKLGSTTVVLRNSGWLERFECPSGLRAVGLEDPVFNKAFAVFGADQVEARVVLTPTFMQQLNDLEAAYKGGHIRCAFETTELLIALEGLPRFGIGGLFSSLVDRARVESIARDIEQVFTLIDHFRDA
jgi:hypothetical protein